MAASCWAWGAEPDLNELRETARLIGEHTGLGDPSAWEDPVPFERVRLPPSRLPVPEALKDFCDAEPYERARRTYGQAYRDLIRAYRGDFGPAPRNRNANNANNRNSNARNANNANAGRR